MTVQEKYTQNIIDNDKRIRRFKHDFYAHFIVMKELCKNAQYEELNKYMGVMEQASGFNDTPRYTNNTAVDAIIYDRIQQAKKNEIEIKIEGSVTSECPVNNYDLCTIISNLLRNAIEACMLVDVSERTIQMEIYPYENKFYLCVKNKVHEFVEITNDTVNTTKSNKLDHGFGIQNVKQVVERYEGYFGMSCEEIGRASCV